MCATSSKKKPPGIYGLKPHIKAIPEKNFPSLKLDDLKNHMNLMNLIVCCLLNMEMQKPRIDSCLV